jgi:hypothetical protein
VWALSAQLTYETVFVDYDSAVQYKNLKIIPIRPKGVGGGAASNLLQGVPNTVTLNAAIAQGLVTVSERGTASTENVHWLRIHNSSEKSILVSSGEIMAGGRQDRMITRDTILVPNHWDQYVPVMCVEEGRWSDKEKKIAYGNFANSHLRKVLDSTHNQVLIWKEVDHELEAGGFKNTSLAYLSRNLDKKHMLISDDYFRFFRDKFKNTDSTILGFVCISGNRVIGTDIYAGTNLFYEQLEPLLRGFIDESIVYGAPPVLPQKDIKAYMDKELNDEQSQEQFVKKNGKIFRQFGKVIHVNTF